MTRTGAPTQAVLYARVSSKDQDKIAGGKVSAAGGEAAYRYVEAAVKLAAFGYLHRRVEKVANLRSVVAIIKRQPGGVCQPHRHRSPKLGRSYVIGEGWIA